MIYLGERGSAKITNYFKAISWVGPWEKSVSLTCFLCSLGLIFFSASGVVLRELPGPSPIELVLLLAPMPPLLALCVFIQFMFNRLVRQGPCRAALSPFLLLACCFSYVLFLRVSGADARIERHAVVYHCLEHPSPLCRDVVRRRLTGFNEEEILRIEARASPRRRFAEDLGPISRAALEARYASVVKAFTDRDFELVEVGAREILALVYDFRDIRTYAATARREIEKEREFRHNEAQREHLEFHLRQIDALVDAAAPLAASAPKDPAAAGELRRLALDILHVNPSDDRALAWLRALDRRPASR